GGGGGGVLAIMSGPEPARTEFESLIRPQLKDCGMPYVLVRGLPGNEESPGPNELNYADADTLGKLMAEARVVICRSGYSSVMDLVMLRKKAVFVPTPGQTEQEYLAAHLQEKRLFPYLDQGQFDLKNAVSMANSFDYHFPDMDFGAYQKTLERFINK
ncbi:MAG TPA: glycosyltransferase, partial [Chitinophagaceae bacterium]|nr:glycosyltransferase [Chitinophagaceae bacterium]